MASSSWVVGLALVASACGAGVVEPEFHVNTPASAHGLRVSVLGVYRDGKLTPEAWDLGAALVQPIGGASCDLFYSSTLVAMHPDLAAAIDAYARANGVAEALLGALAPATASDAILLVEISGHPPKVLRTETRLRPVNPGQRTKPASPYETHTITDGASFDVDVSAYSVAEHKIIAELAMRYTGKDTDAAMQAFTTRLARTFPGWTCAGWKPDVTIEPAAITSLQP
jgi:hypothetical protein